MSSAAATYDWQRKWGETSDATNTVEGWTTSSQEFSLPATDAGEWAGIMSVKKTLKNNETQLWWGYSLQYSFKNAFAAPNQLIQFMTLKGYDATNTENQLNFWCHYAKGSSVTNKVQKDCTDTSGAFTALPDMVKNGQTVANFKGGSLPNACPNNSQSNFSLAQDISNAVTAPDNTNYPWALCYNWRSSRDV